MLWRNAMAAGVLAAAAAAALPGGALAQHEGPICQARILWCDLAAPLPPNGALCVCDTWGGPVTGHAVVPHVPVTGDDGRRRPGTGNPTHSRRPMSLPQTQTQTQTQSQSAGPGTATGAAPSTGPSDRGTPAPRGRAAAATAVPEALVGLCFNGLGDCDEP
ncbi:MAG: hypothetical protein AAF677_08200 [Pseudomonadota bacterium]